MTDKSKPDLNTIWKSPFDTSKREITSVANTAEERTLFDDRNKIAKDILDVVKSLVAAIKTFWNKYEVGFVEFWNALTKTSRENFLWCVYPTLQYN